MPPLLSERRNEILSLKVTTRCRHMVEQLAAVLTIKRKRRQTMTSVVEEALRRMAKQEKVT